MRPITTDRPQKNASGPQLQTGSLFLSKPTCDNPLPPENGKRDIPAMLFGVDTPANR
jgi:hypothetical protein